MQTESKKLYTLEDTRKIAHKIDWVVHGLRIGLETLPAQHHPWITAELDKIDAACKHLEAITEAQTVMGENQPTVCQTYAKEMFTTDDECFLVVTTTTITRTD